MFTTPCYVNKNSKLVINSLEKLGYKKSNITLDQCKNLCCFTTGDGEPFYANCDNYDVTEILCNKKVIDCANNFYLFCALAALRDDSDYKQWFTDGYHWENCPEEKADLYSWESYYKTTPHKASVEELTEYFTNLLK